MTKGFDMAKKLYARDRSNALNFKKSALVVFALTIGVLSVPAKTHAQGFATSGISFGTGNGGFQFRSGGIFNDGAQYSAAYRQPLYGYGYTPYSRPFTSFWEVGFLAPNGSYFTRTTVADTSYQAQRQLARNFPYSRVAAVKKLLDVPRNR